MYLSTSILLSLVSRLCTRFFFCLKCNFLLLQLMSVPGSNVLILLISAWIALPLGSIFNPLNLLLCNPIVIDSPPLKNRKAYTDMYLYINSSIISD